MNSRQRRKSKRIWRSLLSNITKSMIKLFSTDRTQELANIWKDFSGEIPADKTLRWNIINREKK